MIVRLIHVYANYIDFTLKARLCLCGIAMNSLLSPFFSYFSSL